MLPELDQLRCELNAVRKRFRTVKTDRISRVQDMDAVRQFVRGYFEAHRENLAGAVGDNRVQSLDALMQDLLRCAQGRTATKRYRDLLGRCAKEINELETVGVVSRGPNASNVLAEREELVIRTLERVCPVAAVCYGQGLSDLEGLSRRSWRGTIVEFREALRVTLDTLAPDEEVKNHAGFRAAAGAPKHSTMKEKVRLVLRARRWSSSQTKPAEDAVDGVENIVGGLVRAVYDRASTGVHTSVGIEEAKRVKDWVTLVLAELLEVGA